MSIHHIKGDAPLSPFTRYRILDDGQCEYVVIERLVTRQTLVLGGVIATADLAWVHQLCADIEPFSVTLGEPRVFGEMVVYLSVNTPRLVEVHQRLVGARSLSPETLQRYFEGDLYVPHLTLGQSAWGMTKEECQEMHREAGTALASIGTFMADGLQIFRGSAPGQYEPILCIPFGS